jgi:hypothetical protein
MEHGPGSDRLAPSFFDDLEGGAGFWAASGDWALSEEAPYSETHAWSLNPEAGAQSGSELSLTLAGAIFVPEDEAHPELSYYEQISIAADSIFSVEASTDLGATWTSLFAYDPGQDAEAWTLRKASLDGFQGEWVPLRFHARQGASQVVDQWLIDDVRVSELQEIPPPAVGPISASTHPAALAAPVTLRAPFGQPGYSGTHTAQWESMSPRILPAPSSSTASPLSTA